MYFPPDSKTTVYGIAKYTAMALTVILASLAVHVDPETGIVTLPPDGVPWYIYVMIGLRIAAGLLQSAEMRDRPDDDGLDDDDEEDAATLPGEA